MREFWISYRLRFKDGLVEGDFVASMSEGGLLDAKWMKTVKEQATTSLLEKMKTDGQPTVSHGDMIILACIPLENPVASIAMAPSVVPQAPAP